LRLALSRGGPVERYTHPFHTYPAGMHADAARDLIALFPGDSVFDPFCGGGTVLVEARAAGRRTHGSDVSPVAVRVARARTATPDDAALTASLARATHEPPRRASGRPIADEITARSRPGSPRTCCASSRRCARDRGVGRFGPRAARGRFSCSSKVSGARVGHEGRAREA
jgi:hypothetical protein